MRRTVGLAGLLLTLVCAAAAEETQLRRWMMPNECVAFPVALLAGEQRFQLLTESQPDYSVSALKAGCLQTGANSRECALTADDSDAACRVASDPGGAKLEGHLSTTAAATGYIYVSNSRDRLVLVDLLVIVESEVEATAHSAVGSYRRSLLSSRAGVAAGSAAVSAQPMGRRLAPYRRLLQSSSNNSASNVIDRISNKVSPKARKWVKIAIIILIVLICLSILSCLICLIRCICWPCCCAARAFK